MNDSDQDLIANILRKTRLFRLTPGRKCPGFANIGSFPDSIDQMPSFKERLNQIIARLTSGLSEDIEESDDDGDST